MKTTDMSKIGGTERRLVIDAITSTPVLAALVPLWSPGMLGSKYADTVVSWCVRHFRGYATAPSRDITGYFEKWSARITDEHLVGGVHDLLLAASNEYDRTDTEGTAHRIKEAKDHVNSVRLRKMAEAITHKLETGDLQGALEARHDFEEVMAEDKPWGNTFDDEEDFGQAFIESDEESLIEFHLPSEQAASDFLGNTFSRSTLVSYLAPAKTGKSRTLVDMAWRAICCRRKTAFFEVGDLGKKLSRRLFITRAIGKPWYSTSPNRKWPCRLEIPKAIGVEWEKGKKGATVELTYDEELYDAPIERKGAWTRCRSIVEQRTKSKEPYFRLSNHPTNSISVAGIRSLLTRWAKEDGFIPEVICIDYADILHPMPGSNKKDTRDQINDTWMALAQMRQELDVCVITATQADTEGYDRWVLDRRNFSGDRRKNDHVTAMIGINMTHDEREKQQCRWNFVDRREGAFSPKQCLFLGQSLALCRPVVVSAL